MALLSWLNGDLFSTLRDKVNAIVTKLNTDDMNWTPDISIGDWNMDVDGFSPLITHSVSDYKKIRVVEVTIRSDDDATYTILNSVGLDGIARGGVLLYSNTQVQLVRTAAGFFDDTTYNSTGYNRGFVKIGYIN